MTHAEDVEAQAGAWLARLDAAGDSDQNLEFTTWLAADPRHRAAYLRLAAAWERSLRLKILRPEGASINPDLLSFSSAPNRMHQRWLLLTIAAAVATIVVSAAWWINADRGLNTFQTEVGGLSRVVLGDGSTVTLNTDTELRVRLKQDLREVELIRGEAQFTVAHDAGRPFEVFARGRLVRAVGTAFDVRIDRGEVMQVIVTEGRVSFVDTVGVHGPHEPALATTTISAGEAAVARGGKVTVRRVNAAETSRRLAWQVGELSFEGETLRAAVAEFNRYNRRELRVDDPAIGSLQVGGTFQALDTDSFVAALERSFGIIAKTTPDGALLLEPGSQSMQE